MVQEVRVVADRASARDSGEITHMDLPFGIWSLTPAGFAFGVVIVVYWLLVSGRLIPRTSHERELLMANKRGDEWKETALNLRAVNNEIRVQNGKLIEANKISEHFYRSINPTTITDTLPSPNEGDNVVA